MEKIEYNGEVYYFINGTFVDSSYVVVPTELSKKIGLIFFAKLEYLGKDKSELLNLIKQTKENYCAKCIEICLYAIDKFLFTDKNFVKSIIPILTSCYRTINQPQIAIQYGLYYLKSLGPSPVLCTSLAAAFCDVKDYKNALKYADKAYAAQGGGVGYTNELSLVYKRIKKETE